MLRIDGAVGEGGGQILRTSLTLSVVTGTPFRIENIRARRKRPGLLRQHLTAVDAAARICGARVDGAAIGSAGLTFTPGPVRPGEHTFAVGTAGSATLVLQTVLPPLLTAAAPSRLTLEGGTHNPMAPPFDFLVHAFLPIVNRMGPRVDARLAMGLLSRGRRSFRRLHRTVALLGGLRDPGSRGAARSVGARGRRQPAPLDRRSRGRDGARRTGPRE